MNKGWHTGMRLTAATMIATVVIAVTAGVAAAQDSDDPYIGPSPTVASETVELQPAAPAEVQDAQVSGATAQQGPATEVKGSSLAFTGTDVVVLAAFGFAALLVGGLVLFARRRTTSA